MANNTPSMKTPKQFIEDYSDKIRTDLSQYNFQVNKLGYMGFLFNLIGETQFDAKNYYDYLFKEGFVLTSREDNNLYMHSFIYGYNPSFSIPSTAYGNFVFNFDFMPKKPDNVAKREIFFTNISFTVSGYSFKTETSYKFVEDRDSYYVKLYTSDGYSKILSSSDSRIVVPFYNVKQFTSKEEYIDVPNYKFGDYYPIYLSTEDSEFISGLNIEVKELNKTYEETFGDVYDIKNVKFLEDAFAKTVFLKTLSPTDYLIELGSGYHGNYIPNSNLKITSYVTKGENGNINVEKESSLDETTSFSIKHFDSNDKLITEFSSTNIRELVNVDFKYSSNGENPLSGEKLRDHILKYVQSRDNLLTEKDYYNIGSQTNSDFKFLFKKTMINENIFYLYKTLRNRYMNPLLTTNDVIKQIDNSNTPSDELSYNLIDSSDTNGFMDESYRYTLYYSNSFQYFKLSSLDISLQNNTELKYIELNWNSIENALYYVIERENVNTTEKDYFKVFTNTFLDKKFNGMNFYNFVGDSEKFIFSPSIKINSIDYISPFLYVWNEMFKWYDGYILYDSFITNIKKVTKNIDEYDLPIIFVSIEYNKENKNTSFQFKSNQDLSHINIVFDCPNLNLYDITPNRLSDDTFEYIYNNDSTEGLIFNTLNFEIKINDIETNNNAAVIYMEDSNQIIDISDQLKLQRFIHLSTKEKYITNIPFIDKTEYDKDQRYYIDSITDFITQSNFRENRLPGDEVQYRFLNTGFMKDVLVNNVLKQNYNHSIQMPLKLKVDIYIDNDYLHSYSVDLNSEKIELYKSIAAKLQSDYTGTNIKYYNSQLIDFIHSERPFIKQVIIDVKDSDDREFNNGIEVYDDKTIMKNIQTEDSIVIDDRKLYLLNYTPLFFYWNLDNIDLNIKYI